MEGLTFIQNCFNTYDDTFTWYVPDEQEKASIMEELCRETYDNPHLHINKYDKKDIVPAAKRKGRNDILFIMPDGVCAIAHLLYSNKASEEEDLHFVFFSTPQSAMKYILKQYRTECFGEKEFVLSKRDKAEIAAFALQFILFLVFPGIRGIVAVVLGIALYAMILYDWKESGFNLFRDYKLDHVKVIPLLRYQIAYISIMTLLFLLGIVLKIMISI